MRAIAVWAAAGLLLVALPSAPAASEPAIGEIPRGIAQLLDDRGSAFRSHDPQLLASTMRPGPFAGAELQALDNATGIDFATFTLNVTTRYAGDIASDRVRRAYPGQEAVAFQVSEEHAIAGYEAEPYAQDSFYTFARDQADPQDRYDGWRIVSSTDFELMGGHSARGLWHTGPVAAATSEHFMLLARADQIERMRPILQLAEQAYAGVREFWPRPVDARYVIVAPATTADLQQILQVTVDLSKFVAFAAGSATRDDGFTPRGVRIVLQMEHFEQYPPSAQREVLAHELIHAITRPIAGPFTPVWVEEGLAMYGAEEDRGLEQARRGPAPVDFPPDEDFFVGPTPDIVRTYNLSQIAVLALVERFGVEGLVRFYESLGSVRLAPGTQDHHVREAIAGVLDWTAEDWIAAWRERLR